MKVNMQVTGLDEPLEKLKDFTKYVILVLIACVLFIGCCILYKADGGDSASGEIRIFAIIGMLFSIALAVFSVKKLWKK